jgi:hypothetical protein
MWRLLQLVVFLSVYFTGIYYEWTPNGYVLGLLSIGAALAVTLLLSWAFDARRVLLIKQGNKRGPPSWR